MVRVMGLEPIRLSAPDPKSGLATNYNTPATNPTQRYIIFRKRQNLTLKNSGVTTSMIQAQCSRFLFKSLERLSNSIVLVPFMKE